MIMVKVAVTYEPDGSVGQHFGRTEYFKIYEVEGNQILSSKVTDTAGAGHEALAWFLKDLGVEILICGGLGMGARMAVAEAGIELLPGVQGSADDAVKALLAGDLQWYPEASCHHHDHEHGEHGCGHEDHECGHGGCGDHDCK